MGFSYFNGGKWGDFSREERYFCAELYFHFRHEPQKLVRFFLDSPTFSCGYLDASDLEQEWELGFEVCFYRDMCYHFKSKCPAELTYAHYSPKRTFDLCLFSEKKILIIEAKVQQGFKPEQLGDFNYDFEKVVDLLQKIKVNPPSVHVTGLASKRYFTNVAKYGIAGVPSIFSNNYITWEDLYQYTDNMIFKAAEERYKK